MTMIDEVIYKHRDPYKHRSFNRHKEMDPINLGEWHLFSCDSYASHTTSHVSHCLLQ